MLEKDIIQQRGFRNLRNEAGDIVGFQVRVRSDYYRGVYLSEIFAGAMLVDGKVFPKEQVIWEINGQEFTVQEMETRADVHWCCTTDAAILKVYTPGGLAQGYHDVEVRFNFSASYLPPQLQTNLDPDIDPDPNKHYLFGTGRHKRRLLMV